MQWKWVIKIYFLDGFIFLIHRTFIAGVNLDPVAPLHEFIPVLQSLQKVRRVTLTELYMRITITVTVMLLQFD